MKQSAPFPLRRVFRSLLGLVLLELCQVATAQAQDVPQPLLQDLVSEDWWVRERAAAAIGKLEETGAPAVAKIVPLMADTHPRVRYAAIIALSRIGGIQPDLVSDDMLNTVVDALGDSETRKAAVWALSRLGDRALPTLIDVLQHESADRVTGAAEALSSMGVDAAPASQALTQALGHEDPAVRLAAVEALGAIGELTEPAVSTLCRSLRDDEKLTVRAASAAALGAGGTRFELAVDALCRALSEDDSSQVRASAARSLGSAVAFAGGEPLSRLLESLEDEDVSVRLAAADALAEWAQSLRLLGWPSWDSATQVTDALLRRAANDADEFVRRASLRALPALVQLHGDDTEPLPFAVKDGLAAALEHEHWSTREAACLTAMELGGATGSLSPKLVEKLRDAHLHVREAAASALETMPDRPTALILDVARDAGQEKSEPGKQPAGLLAIRVLLRTSSFEIKTTPNASDLVPALRLALRDPFDPETRGRAARCLGDLGAAETLTDLAEALGDDAAAVRVSIVDALGCLGTSAELAAPRLVELLVGDREPRVREAAARTLARIGQPSEKVLEALERARKDEDEGVREAAIEALEALSRR